MNNSRTIIGLFKQPIQYPEFTGIGALIGALGLFGVITTLAYPDSPHLGFGDGYLDASLFGLVVSYFVMRRKVIGTLLFSGLIVPFCYFLYVHYDWPGDAERGLSLALSFTAMYVAVIQKQVRYHRRRPSFERRSFKKE